MTRNDVQAWVGVGLLGLTVGLAACGGGAPAEPPAADEPMETMETMTDLSSTTPSVSFVTPTDGATVSSPVAMEFLVSNYNISPVPSEVEMPREGMGHYHVGIDTECLPVGEVIQQGDPWVHFGDGSNRFETMLAPGPHTLTLQLGDDEHRTLDGLCTTISVTAQ